MSGEASHHRSVSSNGLDVTKCSLVKFMIRSQICLVCRSLLMWNSYCGFIWWTDRLASAQRLVVWFVWKVSRWIVSTMSVRQTMRIGSHSWSGQFSHFFTFTWTSTGIQVHWRSRSSRFLLKYNLAVLGLFFQVLCSRPVKYSSTENRYLSTFFQVFTVLVGTLNTTPGVLFCALFFYWHG